MQNNSNPTADEIDLFELFENLWKNKLTIIIVTCIGIALATLYAFTAKEQWTSKAQVIPPKAVNLGTYLEVQRGYARFTNGEEVDVADSMEHVYSNLIVMLNATDNKLDYLQTSGYFKQQAMELDDIAKQKKLNNMAADDLQIKETEKNKRDSFDISFVAETANNAQQTLQGYVEYTNSLVLNKLFGDLHLQINERIRSLENDIANIKQQTEQGRKNQIMLLKQAIVAAKDANIVEYTGESTIVGNTIIDFSKSGSMFLLGEKYLTARLQSLETSPIIYPISYYQTLTNISGLKQLLEFEPSGMVFEYTRAPSFPLEKDKPKKGLILILGVLLGGMLGCGIALVRFALSSRKSVL